eukprot:scaffold94963_cov35-Phaeocystis_antarctica.AAC.1
MFLGSHTWPFTIDTERPKVPTSSGGYGGGPACVAPFAPCAFVGFGLKVQNGLAARFQRAPHVPRGRVDGSRSREGMKLDAPAPLAQGRANVSASQRRGWGSELV